MNKKPDPFEKLGKLPPSAPSDAARKRALAMAMSAFDDAEAEKSAEKTQGSREGQRPNIIKGMMKGLFAMENRVAVTAAFTGLLLLPLGYILYDNTALTPIGGALTLPPLTQNEAPIIDGRAGGTQVPPIEKKLNEGFAEARNEVLIEAEPSPRSGRQSLDGMTAAPNMPSKERVRTLPSMSTGIGQLAANEEVDADSVARRAPSAPVSGRAKPDLVDDQGHYAPPNSDAFAPFENAQIKSVSTEPVSTFSIDVDTASYSYMRRALNEGRLPSPDSIRVEELINAFDYAYDGPGDSAAPFATHITLAPSPWDEGKQVMRVAVQGFEIAAEDRPAANLVFLIDTSGSMDAPDKLPLLIKSFSLMLDALDDDDTVSIVTYAGSAGVALPPTSAVKKSEILRVLNNLRAGGSTAGAAGIEAAYGLAAEAFIEGGSNQVILATDGDFNVGLSNPDGLVDYIAAKRDEGVFLSILGFGTGNLDDHTMQALAQNGNGTAYYIDGLREAQRVLVKNITATLVPIAKDVKIQVEFNPAQVAEYRLIGYETRALDRQDFNNDRVDAGEVGAGASVTAIYEITPRGSNSVLVDPLRYGDADEGDAARPSTEIGFFKLRYKLPNEDQSRLIEVPITQGMALPKLDAADDDMRFALAVAGLGQKLSHNEFVHDLTYADIRKMAQGARGDDLDGYRSQFLALVDLADALDR